MNEYNTVSFSVYLYATTYLTTCWEQRAHQAEPKIQLIDSSIIPLQISTTVELLWSSSRQHSGWHLWQWMGYDHWGGREGCR